MQFCIGSFCCESFFVRIRVLSLVWLDENVVLTLLTVATYRSNRAAAYAAMGEWSKSLEDAEEAIALKPEWGKAYSRRGVALYMLGRGDDALAAYQSGLAHDPDNKVLQEGLKQSKDLIQANEWNVLGEEFENKRKWKEARDMFVRASDLIPNQRLFWVNRSHASTMLSRCRRCP